VEGSAVREFHILETLNSMGKIGLHTMSLCCPVFLPPFSSLNTKILSHIVTFFSKYDVRKKMISNILYMIEAIDCNASSSLCSFGNMVVVARL